jgi:putative transposase
MKQDSSELPSRRSVRLNPYDYGRPSAYFLTICAHSQKHLFGKMFGSSMRFSALGKIVEECWAGIPRHFPHVRLSAHIVMPNHLHGIVIIQHRPPALESNSFSLENRAQHAVPLRQKHPAQAFGEPIPGSIPTIVRSFKSAASKMARAISADARISIWQRGYYEHVIRDEYEFRKAVAYIRQNRERWQQKKQSQNFDP